MHFRKRLIAVLLLVLLVASVFVISIMDSDEEGLFSLLQNKKETIYFWYDDESTSDYINSAAVIFGEKNNVRVLPRLVSESAYLEAINQATLQGEEVPDAYLISNDGLEKAYLAGLAMEITDDANIVNLEYFPQVAIDAVTYKGKKVAYPLFFETAALLYNENYLQEWALQQARREATEAGTEQDESWLEARRDEIMLTAVPDSIDDILSIADSFDPPETIEGIFSWDVSDIFYNYYFVGNYMLLGGATGDDKSVIDINNEEVVSCLQIYKGLNEFFYIESDKVSYESVVQDFIDGKIVFTIATTDVIKRLEDAKKTGEFAYEYNVSVIPNPGEELQARSLSVTETVVVNGYSEKQELANRFAAFLVKDYAGEMYERTGRISACKKVNENHEKIQAYLDGYAKSVSLPKMIETGDYWVQLEILFSKVWNGGNIRALVTEMSERINTQLTSTE